MKDLKKMKNNPNEMENSELLMNLFYSRDNLVNIRRRLFDGEKSKELEELFDLERKRYDELLQELYKRMKGH